MARQPMVTRTVKISHVNVLCLDIINEAPFQKIVDISREIKDKDKLLKKIKGIVDSDEVVAVRIIGTETEEVLYGMTEQKFIETADILPSRT